MQERIKAIRTALGISQTKFAERLSMSRSAVCKLESGENSPSEQTSMLICREFNVNEDWLRTGEGEMFIELDPEDELMIWAGTVLKDKPDSFRRRFVRMLSKMTDEEWEWVESKLLELFNDTEKGG